MAQKVSVTFACDYDQKAIAQGEHETRRFSLDGRDYEIDLCATHSKKFDDVVGRYADHARRASAWAERRAKRRSSAHRQHSAAIRSWAKETGIAISDRGRIPAEVVSRYEASRHIPRGNSWSASAALVRLVEQIGFAERPGGATYRISPLNAVFFDNHQSWYAVHWTTPLEPQGVVDLCHEYLGLGPETRALVQSTGADVIETSLASIRDGELSADDTKLFRIDTEDFAVIWEPSSEHERMRATGERVPFTAIFGFGSSRVNVAFGASLMERTATDGIVDMSESIWEEMSLGDEEDLEYRTIGSSRGVSIGSSSGLSIGSSSLSIGSSRRL